MFVINNPIDLYKFELPNLKTTKAYRMKISEQIELSNKTARLPWNKLVICLFALCLTIYACKSPTSPANDTEVNEDIAIDEDFDNLIWSDEFDMDGAIDTAKWFHQTRLPNGQSWYNGELQHYTDRTDNTIVEDGLLKIIAKKEAYTDQGQTKQYTSARLNSKFVFQKGRVEIRAKLPIGEGTWPAIWMLGQNITENGAYWYNLGYGTTPWPACGEIDIMEHWGTNQNQIKSATHTPSSSGATLNSGGQTIATASTAFHVYALDWTDQQLVFSVDDVVHYTYNPSTKNSSTWPFTAPHYLLMNVAIQPSIEPEYTSSAMEIDYVRVYQ
ncbi:MAG: glycoside hydrolase family 16 protein [Bacteroidia bacterium]|nr:glycoside hydrolase family 16 protein [Bacteroidia bacterium]